MTLAECRPPALPSSHRPGRAFAALIGALAAYGGGALAADAPPLACPDRPVTVARSRGGATVYQGTVDGIQDLCRLQTADDSGDFYFGLWRTDWPGAGQAYPALRKVVSGQGGTREQFVTRAMPGLQWNDVFVNEGREPLNVGDRVYQTLRMSHEREGIEGNTYHSVITNWRDVRTGVILKVVENQISGQSYGPDTTWTAVRVEVR